MGRDYDHALDGCRTIGEPVRLRPDLKPNVAWRCACGRWKMVGSKEWREPASDEAIIEAYLAQVCRCGQSFGVHVPPGDCTPRPSPLAGEFMFRVDRYVSGNLSIRSYQEATEALLEFVTRHRIEIHQALLRGNNARRDKD